jgi:hypothetical protein
MTQSKADIGTPKDSYLDWPFDSPELTYRDQR